MAPKWEGERERERERVFNRSLFRLEAIASHETNKRYITSVRGNLWEAISTIILL